ncbi:hypothetical protein JW711_05005 [Candidatus Woesearchaeota archaeon]|nr:hypothetical protein [Candidatus Woesearchaeota archaeon]
MDMKKTAKKIAALVAGTTMLGATIMGAAADLSAYPAPFIADGAFSGKIVVGEKAATSDVVGAIDLAASLQAEAVSSSLIDVPGAAGKASVSGDAAEFKSSSDVLALGEAVGDVKQTFTADDLAALKSGVLQTGSSSTPVKQYLKFESATMNVQYKNSGDVLADYLVIPEDSSVFEYMLEFTESAESDLDQVGATTTYDLTDLENEVITILGAPFTVVDAQKTVNELSLTLLGGQVADVLRDGETKTYTIDGNDYEVTAVFIADDDSAKLSVNGVMTKSLESGETQILGSDVTVGVQSVLTNNREGLVEFYLGANKLELIDSDYNDAVYSDSETIKVKGETVDNAQLIIKATNVTGGTSLKLNYIKYNVSADDGYDVAAGAGAREPVEADNPGAFLTDTWDITYAGMVKVASTPIVIAPDGADGYKIEFTNVNGDEFDFPYVSTAGATFKWGNEDDDLVFTEYLVAANSYYANTTFISEDDYFIVSDKADMNDDKAATKVLQYKYINTNDNKVTFSDLSGGDVVVSYTLTAGTDGCAGDLIVDAVSHSFWLNETTENLSIDLDGSGAISNGDYVKIVAKNGAVIGLGAQVAGTAPVAITGAGITLNITTDDSHLDEGSDETSTVFINQTAAADELTMASSGVDIAGTTADLVSDPDDDDLSKGYSTYGALFTHDTSDDIPELTIDYPVTQKYAQAFVTAGVIDVVEGASSDDGSLTTESVNPIAVGLAVLDSDAPALGSTNLIVVGGPCANTVAAELMGNPANCAEGFTPGKAVIKLFPSKNALLVAGYSAQDTLGATYVLADYEDYDLSGNEVEVVVADLNTISVNAVE